MCFSPSSPCRRRALQLLPGAWDPAAAPLRAPDVQCTHRFLFYVQNYGQGCLNTFNCQQQIVNIDSASTVAIYSLSTVASQYQISVNGQGIVPNSANRAGFAQTVTSWTRS